MPDGAKRKRRLINPLTKVVDNARKVWYATFRSGRFNNRFGLRKRGSE